MFLSFTIKKVDEMIHRQNNQNPATYHEPIGFLAKS